MKPIESLQSNAGQLALDIPAPIGDVYFDNKSMLLFAAITGAVALGGLKFHRDNTKEIADLEFPPGSDANEIMKPRALRHRMYDFVLATTLSAAAIGGFAHMADPFKDESRTEMDSLSVILDTSALGLTTDVMNSDGVPVARIKAAVDEINGFDGLADNGITVRYIAAGTTSEAVATIEPGDDRNVVVDGYELYLRDESNLGTGSNATPDLEGAIRIAEATDSDAIFIVAGSLESVDGSLLVGQNTSEERRISVVALGQPGSTVIDESGNEIAAPINESFNDLALGAEDSNTTSSQEDLSNIIEDIIDEQYVVTERSEVDGFGKFALYAGVLAGAGYFARFLNETYGKRLRDRKNK